MQGRFVTGEYPLVRSDMKKEQPLREIQSIMKTTKRDGNTNSINRMIFTAATILISLCVLFFFLRYSTVNMNYRAAFSAMLDGTAHRPFVTRVLIPWLTTFTSMLFPFDVRNHINDWIGNNPVFSIILSLYHVSADQGFEAVASLFWQYLSLFGYYLAFKSLLLDTINLSEKKADTLTLLSTCGLLPLMLFGYIYDLPQLFLCTQAFSAIAAKRKIMYFIVFILAVINKETAIVLIVPSILLFWNNSQPNLLKAARGVGLQLLIFLSIRIPLIIHFRQNPGMFIEPHLITHKEGIIDYPLYGIAVIALFFCLTVLFLYKWKQKPALVNLGLGSGAILLVLFVFGGMPQEFRVFYEVIGVVLISILQTISMRCKFALDTKAASTEEFIRSVKKIFSKKLSSINTPTPNS